MDSLNNQPDSFKMGIYQVAVRLLRNLLVYGCRQKYLKNGNFIEFRVIFLGKSPKKTTLTDNLAGRNIMVSVVGIVCQKCPLDLPARFERGKI